MSSVGCRLSIWPLPPLGGSTHVWAYTELPIRVRDCGLTYPTIYKMYCLFTELVWRSGNKRQQIWLPDQEPQLQAESQHCTSNQVLYTLQSQSTPAKSSVSSPKRCVSSYIIKIAKTQVILVKLYVCENIYT